MLTEIILAVAGLIGYAYWIFRSKSNYWTKLGVKQPKSNPFPLGNNPITCTDALFNRKNQGDIAYEQYQEFKDEKFYGTYMLPKCFPALMVKDPEYLKDIMVKDFNHFVDRNSALELFGKDGPTKTDHAWQKQLTNSKGDYWKDARTTFSPIFTSGKLKMMIQFINIVSKEVEKHIGIAAKSGDDVELKNLFGKFSMDTLASCAFGIQTGVFNAGKEVEPEFVKNARMTFQT